MEPKKREKNHEKATAGRLFEVSWAELERFQTGAAAFLTDWRMQARQTAVLLNFFIYFFVAVILLS